MEGIEQGEQDLYVTLEEPPEQIMREADLMGFDMRKSEGGGPSGRRMRGTEAFDSPEGPQPRAPPRLDRPGSPASARRGCHGLPGSLPRSPTNQMSRP